MKAIGLVVSAWRLAPDGNRQPSVMGFFYHKPRSMQGGATIVQVHNDIIPCRVSTKYESNRLGSLCVVAEDGRTALIQ